MKITTFLEAFDISMNIDRITIDMRNIHGVGAAALLIPVGAAAMFFGWLGWQFA